MRIDALKFCIENGVRLSKDYAHLGFEIAFFAPALSLFNVAHLPFKS